MSGSPSLQWGRAGVFILCISAVSLIDSPLFSLTHSLSLSLSSHYTLSPHAVDHGYNVRFNNADDDENEDDNNRGEEE